MKPVNCRNFGLFDNLFKKKNVDEKMKEPKKEKDSAKASKENEDFADLETSLDNEDLSNFEADQNLTGDELLEKINERESVIEGLSVKEYVQSEYIRNKE